MPKLLDLFCGGGGASMGYHLAGFEVTGVDIVRKKNYPFTFIKANAMDLLNDLEFLNQFDVIHASPPCQVYTSARHLMKAQGKKTSKPDLLADVRKALEAWGGTYVIENVVGAPMGGVIVCGSSFGLKVRRHRKFESNKPLETQKCNHRAQGRPVGVYGSMNDSIPKGGKTASTLIEGQQAMGIDWLGWGSLKESIPPLYTQFIGKQIL
jgi:DNA (cytosine-5)-methyltransferase 1